MIVCLCEGLTDRDIDAAAVEGARKLGDLSRGGSKRCGQCSAQVRQMIRAAQGHDAHHQPHRTR